MIRRVIPVALLALTLGCGGREPAEKSFTLATTTSIDNSGLLHHLSRRFYDQTGIVIHPLVVGSGKALRLGREGRVEVLLTHDPEGEAAFVRSGNAVRYGQFARNDFALAGPAANPARVAPSDTVAQAFHKIHASGSPFASRGDESGTHVRELRIWASLPTDPTTNPRYISLGQSMSVLLRSADELHAYVLTDLATFTQLASALELRLLVDQGPLLENIYAVTLVKGSGPRPEFAATFVEWLLSPAGRDAVASFRIGGRQMFFPVG